MEFTVIFAHNNYVHVLCYMINLFANHSNSLRQGSVIALIVIG